MRYKNLYRFLTVFAAFTLASISIGNQQGIIDAKECGCDEESVISSGIDVKEKKIFIEFLSTSDQIKQKIEHTGNEINITLFEEIKIFRFKDDEFIVNIPLEDTFEEILSVYIVNNNIISTSFIQINPGRNNYIKEIIIENSGHQFKMLLLLFMPLYLLQKPVIILDDEFHSMLKETTLNSNLSNFVCKIIMAIYIGAVCGICSYGIAKGQPVNFFCFLCGTSPYMWNLCDAIFPPEQNNREK